MKRFRGFLLAVGLFAAGSELTKGHAFLNSAEPAVGSTLAVSPAAVKIWFTKRIVNSGSDIQVFDAKGTEVDAKNAKVDAANPFLMVVSVSRLASGEYRVVWNAICRDTHHTTGTFTFSITGP